jgi:regulator of protease activity HflC (stomatin/prohibitin superfamily)
VTTGKVVAAVVVGILAVVTPFGFIVVEPNGSKVLLLFGSYKGTVKRSGFQWVNPFNTKRAISLRARTLNGDKLKVNDLAGNPVEIAAIVVWRVRDTFRASFEVDDYSSYVSMQSETAVRHLASSYPYDAEEETMSLRRNVDEVSGSLQKELQERLDRAGVEVMEARLSHLAYAPEIASAMLRRQQAAAIIAARQRIVEGAVGMVEMALDRLEEYQKLELDNERKAAMVSNLLVVLCSEHAAQPVLNTGTLYQ